MPGTGSTPRLGALAGAVLAAGLVAVAVALLVQDRSSGPAAPTATSSPATVAPVDDGGFGPAVPADFLAAWERAARATFAVTEVHERTVGTEVVRTERRVVQRPPDRLVRSAAGVRGRLGDEEVACDATGTCRRTPTVSFDAEVAAARADLAALVDGDDPAYGVSAGGDCWRLTLRRVVPAPPWGREATWCFDPATGIRRSLEVVRDEGADRWVAVDRSTEVDEDELTVTP